MFRIIMVIKQTKPITPAYSEVQVYFPEFFTSTSMPDEFNNMSASAEKGLAEKDGLVYVKFPQRILAQVTIHPKWLAGFRAAGGKIEKANIKASLTNLFDNAGTVDCTEALFVFMLSLTAMLVGSVFLLETVC